MFCNAVSSYFGVQRVSI